MSNSRKVRGIVWIVSGPSGSGKTSLCNGLLSDRSLRKNLVKSVSVTTRAKRRGEKEGVDYLHVGKEEFLRLKKRGAFLEAEKIFGAYYGTPKRPVLDVISDGKDALLCIDVKGARHIRRFFKKRAISIFILAPERKVLARRLKGRSTESKKDVGKRLGRAKIEISCAGDYDYVVVNDDFHRALEKLKSIMLAKRCEGAYVLRTIGKIA